jgi:uncharacterized protein YtpQ (UPF0354 family)
MDPGTFTALAEATLVAAGHPVEVVRPLLLRVGGPGGKQVLAQLDNLLAEARRSPEALDAILARCVGSAEAALRPSAGRAEDILPLLRHEDLVRRTWAARPGAPRMPALPFAGPIQVCFGFDGEHSLRLVSREAADQLALDDATLLARATANLRERLVPELVGDGPVWQLVSGGTYDGAWLLDDAVWEGMSQRIPGTLLASVPARDVLLLSSLAIPGGREALAALSKRAREDVVHPLWEGVLVRIGGTWQAPTG